MSTIHSDLWPLALHEAGHVLASFFANHVVEKVFVGRPRGYVQVVYPLTCESLATRWAESPIAAAGISRIVGAIQMGHCLKGCGPAAMICRVWPNGGKPTSLALARPDWNRLRRDVQRATELAATCQRRPR
jgi:hypothetical protein